MSSITISLEDNQFERLKSLAEEAGVSPEELIRANLEEWLSRPEGDFEAAAKRVLAKNAELYRRLA